MTSTPAEEAETPRVKRGRGVPQPYDFRRPNKFSRDHMRALQIVNETFARQMSTILSTSLRAVSHVTLAGVDQLTYDEYVRRTPNPSYLTIFSLEPLPGAMILNIPTDLAMAAVDRMLGGSGVGHYPSRSLSDIEIGLMSGMVERVLKELVYAFESLLTVDVKVVGTESNPQFAQIAAPSDMIVVISFDMRIGEMASKASLCLPFAALQPVLESINSNSLFAGSSPADLAAAARAVETRLGEAAVEVTVAFNPVTLTSKEVVDLAEGDVLPLRHAVDAPLTVHVAGVPRFAAVAGKKGKRLACLIVDPHQEIAR